MRQRTMILKAKNKRHESVTRWESLTRSRVCLFLIAIHRSGRTLSTMSCDPTQPTNQTTHCSDEAAEAAPILPHRIKVRYCALLFAGWLAGWTTICMKGTLDGGRGWLFFPSLCLFALLWICVFGGGSRSHSRHAASKQM